MQLNCTEVVNSPERQWKSPSEIPFPIVPHPSPGSILVFSDLILADSLFNWSAP